MTLCFLPCHCSLWWGYITGVAGDVVEGGEVPLFPEDDCWLTEWTGRPKEEDRHHCHRDWQERGETQPKVWLYITHFYGTAVCLLLQNECIHNRLSATRRIISISDMTRCSLNIMYAKIIIELDKKDKCDLYGSCNWETDEDIQGKISGRQMIK